MAALDGKVALVTGAGQGIGRGIALAFAKGGAAVAVVDKNAETASRTAEQLQQEHGQAIAIPCDVRSREQIDEAVAAAVRAFGPIGILVNCAVPAAGTPFEQLGDEDMLLHFQTGLMATFYTMQACFPYMKERGGKIINFGSNTGTSGRPGMAAYAAAKEGIRGLSKCVALEWARYRINVNVICPSALTPGLQRWLESEAGGADAHLARIPMGRFGDPERDIGRAAVFLAGPDSDYVTGHTLFVDGGKGSFK